MSSCSFQSVIEVPELLLLIAEYLDTSDIVSCMATSKGLARDLEPCLWRHLSLKSKAPSREALLRNRHHIRTFRVEKFYNGTSWRQHGAVCLGILADGLPLPSRPYGGRKVKPTKTALEDPLINPTPINLPPINLRSIDLPICPRDDDVRRTLIENLGGIGHQSYRCLSALTIPTWPLQQNPSRTLVSKHLLNYMPNLNRLTVGSGGFACLGTVGPFLIQCFSHPRLASLHCKFYIKAGFNDEKLRATFLSLADATRSKEGTEQSLIKDLRLPWTKRGYVNSILLPFLTVQGPCLESMYVPMVSDAYDKQLVQTIDKFFPNLRHLSVAWDHREWLEDRTAIAMICGCTSGLKSYHSFLDMQRCRRLTSDVIKPLVDHHFTTLEIVEFAYGECDSDNQYLLLEKCPNLKRLWISPGVNRAGLGKSIVCHRNIADWVCLEIRELGLTYEGERKHAVQAAELYTQIGRLVHLEYLAIGRSVFEPFTYEYDLTLHIGWLSKLDGLKKLRRLHITTDLWSHMAQNEVEFIHQNWPALQIVSFGCGEQLFNATIRNSSHWRWLCEMRPWLRLVCGYHP
ncbi:MAG: hypothetical protein J3Q66DRAFT_397438 [Benniella sp.]|nr:MAG: hypothetical protein J3Q66DRAFT_397438 [Benniella sp.]